MKRLQFTLLSDGSSDRALVPILLWSLQRYGGVELPEGEWADLRHLKVKELGSRMRMALELFPCQVLFVHRDAEKQPPVDRRAEILSAATGLPSQYAVPWICVIPVRMQEAWLLADERAIRMAAGNPRGTQALSLPPLDKIEGLPDPKHVLHAALASASGLTGRRLKKFRPSGCCHLIAEFAAEEGFSTLLGLPSFRQLVADIEALAARGWR